MPSRRAILGGASGLAILFFGEEYAREWLTKDDNKLLSPSTTFWDIDDPAEKNNTGEQVQQFTNEVIDTIGDRKQGYLGVRETLIQASDTIPDRQIQNPAVEEGDTFYGGKYIVHNRVYPEDATGTSGEDKLETFTAQGNEYKKLTATGFDVPKLGSPDTTSLSIAVQCGEDLKYDELRSIGSSYDTVGRTAHQRLMKERSPQNPIEEQSLKELYDRTTKQLNTEKQGTDQYKQLSNAQKELQGAIGFFEDNRSHYGASSKMFRNISQQSSVEEGTVRCDGIPQ